MLHPLHERGTYFSTPRAQFLCNSCNHATHVTSLTMAKPQPDKSRILIVDDHPLFCEGLRQMIDRNAQLVVCGQVPDATGAMKAVAELKPDLVLVDISLEGTN